MIAMAIIVPTLTGDAYAKTSLSEVAAAAVARAPARDEPDRPGPVPAPDEGSPDLALHRLHVGRDHRPDRRDPRLHRRLLWRLDRQRDHALRRHRPVAADLLHDPDHRRGARQGIGHRRRHRDRADGLDARLSPRPRGVPQAARGGLRPGRPGARAHRAGGSSRATSCPRRWRRSSWPRRSASPTRSSPRRPSRSWVSASARPTRASATCSRTSRRTSWSAPGSWSTPAVTIVLVVLAASFLGDGLRDALDPRQRIEAK